MSAESDGSDEFYDAEDNTPGGLRSRSGSRVAEKLESLSPTSTLPDDVAKTFINESDEFAEEEQFLEQLKREAEERRKKEDAELQRKVQSLERRRNIKEQDRKVTDLEKRKRKLKKLRQLVTEDGPTVRPLELMSESCAEELAALQDQDADSDVISINSEGSLTSSNRSNNSSQPSSGQNTLATGMCLASGSALGLGATGGCAVPMEITETSTDCEVPVNGTVDMIVRDIPEKELSGPEPDIVQSTYKPRHPSSSDAPDTENDSPRPNDLPVIHVTAAPKVPPRRKKKRLEEGACGGEPAGNVHSPTSTVLHLTKELECALDMEGATCGQHTVQSRDDASTKAETGDESSQSGSVNLTVTRDGGHMRPRSNSGSRFLTDEEILEQISVLNLDTGEKIPLSLAEEKLPQGVNPITLHILRRTKEYSSDTSLHKACHSDEDDEDATQSADSTQTLSRQAKKMKRKGMRMTKIIGKKMGKTMTMIKQAAEEALNQESESDDEVMDGRKQFKVKAARGHTGPCDFSNVKPVQDLSAGTGAVWTMKFSLCGRLLATGSQDNVLRVWVLKESLSYFDEMRQKYSESKVTTTFPQDGFNFDSVSEYGETNSTQGMMETEEDDGEEDIKRAPFVRKPFCVYRGHTADLLDLSWSKNYFILSSSMDKTVRLWHISRRECLCCFQHIDFVTAIAFHPRDDRYFISGSLDGKVRLWNIPDKKVALWNEVPGQTKLITAASFCQNGKFAVVGTYDGRCILYSTDQLKYHAQIFVKSTRGKNSRGRKVTGVEALPNEDKILVSSNDSRVRLYDIRDLSLTCKYKGCVNNSSQIKASFSANGRYIICGSEDYSIYVWRTSHESQKFTSARRDRNSYWEAIRAHNAVVTAACFAPNPSLIIRPKGAQKNAENKTPNKDYLGEVFVSADFTGAVKVFKNRFRPPSDVSTK